VLTRPDAAGSTITRVPFTASMPVSIGQLAVSCFVLCPTPDWWGASVGVPSVL